MVDPGVVGAGLEVRVVVVLIAMIKHSQHHSQLPYL